MIFLFSIFSSLCSQN